MSASRDTGEKRAWLAALLSFLYPGLGHLYLRAWVRGGLWFLLALATAALLVPPEVAASGVSVDAVLRASERIPFEATATMFAVTLVSMLDAYWIARKGRGAATAAGDGPEDQGAGTCPECGRDVEEDIDFCHWCSAELE